MHLKFLDKSKFLYISILGDIYAYANYGYNYAVKLSHSMGKCMQIEIQ
jgi:hypothetical protein